MMQHVGRIYCCQPSYGSGHPESARAFWLAAAGELRGILTLAAGGGSLLANVFNRFWIHALQLQQAYDDGQIAFAMQTPAGRNPFVTNEWAFQFYWRMGWEDASNRCREQELTHFVMLHDDVAPEDGWLDMLLQDLVKHDADVLSAVVPIKNGEGLTSTAIDNPKDLFRVERRIALAELEKLPPVFSAKDCGYPNRMLLVNTGCWICRFDREWRKPPFCFTITDAIQESKEGRFSSNVAPEDWNFSRHVQRAGGKVLATQRIKLDHWGRMAYPTVVKSWGSQKYDHVYGDNFGHAPIGHNRLKQQELLPV
jgi:hypothetical protein